MKRQDLLAVAIIVFIAGIFSYVIANKFITPKTKKQTAEVVTPISPEFMLPDKAIFNSEAVNPTVRIQIGPIENPEPFTSPR